MSTHALTVMQEESGTEIAVLYRQFDGYLSAHGAELKEFLKPIKIVNGIPNYKKGIANGGACLAAQIVAHFKEEVGGFYLQPAGTRLDFTYYYFVKPNGANIHLRVEYGDETLFDGNIENFDPTIEEEDHEPQ